MFVCFPAIGVWCHDSQRRSLRGHLHTVHEDHDHRQTAGEYGSLNNIPKMPPRRDGDGGASWDTSLTGWGFQKKKKNKTAPPQSQWLEISHLEGVSHTRTRSCTSAALSVRVSGSKTSENQCFSISLQAAGKGSWSSPTWPWLVFFVCVCMCVFGLMISS